MRVLHFYKTAFPDTVGGVEQVIDQIAQGGSSMGVQTDVLSLTPHHAPRTIEFGGYRLHRAKLDFQARSTAFSIAAFSRFAELSRRADVVHYHFPWPFMDLVHFVDRVQKPTVVTYHSDIVRQKLLLRLYRPLKRKFLDSVTRIVATSPNYAATSDILAKYAEKVRVIPIGLNKATYPQPLPGKLYYWRSRLRPKFFLFIGVIRYYKGLHILLAAAQSADYPIVIVGTGPLEMELKLQAARLGLRNIYFLGHLPDDDKVALLTLCYAVVFPSHLRSEAFGISLLEGAMFGKPMISCEIGTGTTFINIANRTGLVVPPDNPAALRQAMNHLWEHPEIAAEMGQCAEAWYWERFTAEKMVNAYVDLYDEVIRSYRGGGRSEQLGMSCR